MTLEVTCKCGHLESDHIIYSEEVMARFGWLQAGCWECDCEEFRGADYVDLLMQAMRHQS